MTGNRISDWKKDWISYNGKTNGYEVRICSMTNDILYEGCFREIPKHLLDRAVLDYAQVLTASNPQHIGAYVLKI